MFTLKVDLFSLEELSRSKRQESGTEFNSSSLSPVARVLSRNRPAMLLLP